MSDDEITPPEEYIRSFNSGTDSIDLSNLSPMYGGLRPIQLHRKEDGAVDDSPSYCMVLVDGLGCHYWAEFSERTLMNALEKCKR